MNNFFMKKIFLLFIFAASGLFVFSQEQDADSLHQTAKNFMRQGDFENALVVLNRALEIRPNDVDIMKDQAFVYYLKRDFANSIQTGNVLISKPDADVQSFQILGLSYKAIAAYKDADKMYKTGLKKFPNSGVLYSEYGDLLSENKNDAGAIKLWEKGVQVDPNQSSNYYYAIKYYDAHNNALWAVLYSETFINIESLTKRTIEIKDILLSNYKKLFSSTALTDVQQKGTPFEKAVAATFTKLNSITNQGLTPESLTQLRARFILDWDQNNSAKFPYRLFDYQRQLLQEGMFDAYNQWLFGASSGTETFQVWVSTHNEDVIALQNFQRNSLYKIPQGQYYPH
jgi:tetratricopeptide (TPR) repeat protein